MGTTQSVAAPAEEIPNNSVGPRLFTSITDLADGILACNLRKECRHVKLHFAVDPLSCGTNPSSMESSSSQAHEALEVLPLSLATQDQLDETQIQLTNQSNGVNSEHTSAWQRSSSVPDLRSYRAEDIAYVAVDVESSFERTGSPSCLVCCDNLDNAQKACKCTCNGGGKAISSSKEPQAGCGIRRSVSFNDITITNVVERIAREDIVGDIRDKSNPNYSMIAFRRAYRLSRFGMPSVERRRECFRIWYIAAAQRRVAKKCKAGGIIAEGDWDSWVAF